MIVLFVVAYFVVGYFLCRMAARRLYTDTKGAGWDAFDAFMMGIILLVWPIFVPLVYVITRNKRDKKSSLSRKIWGIK